VRVYVAEDHPVFLQGMIRAIESRPTLELAGCAANGREALEQITVLQPDVTVLDVKMPALEGPEVLEELRRREIDTRVVFLSAMLDREIVYGALAAGAAGYLSKHSTPDELCDALEAVARGETVIPPEIQARLVQRIREREEELQRPRLPAREHEVLSLIAEGCSAPDIGRRLHLSPATVKTHMKHLYAKLGVSERAAAIAEAMRAGLIH
jgi:two-component system nitrate/nitrite response regulator NarL